MKAEITLAQSSPESENVSRSTDNFDNSGNFEVKVEKCSLEKEFTSSTSCHGMQFWFGGKNTLQRLFWFILVLGMTSIMIEQVYERVTAYYLYKTSTEISREFPDSIEFPAVTVCNFNRFFFPESAVERKAMLLLNGISPETFDYVLTNNITNTTTFLKEIEIFKQYSNYTVSQFLNRRGYQLAAPLVLIDCRYALNKCTAADFKPVLTESGKCYTFNANATEAKRQVTGGAGSGLSITLDVLHWNYTEEPENGRIETGVRIQVHSQNEPPDITRRGFAVPVGSKAYVSVSRKDTTVMYKPWGQCDPQNEKKLKFFSNYTLVGCMKECFTSHVIDRCGCRTFDQYWAEGWAPECTPFQMANCSSPLLSILAKLPTSTCYSCTIPCTFTEYPVFLSYSFLPNLKTAEYFQKQYSHNSNYIEQNILALDVSFRDIAITKEVQSKKVDESALLSDIGGQLGLWIGMSLITVVEIIQYLILRLCACCKPVDPNKTASKRAKSEERKANEATIHVAEDENL